MRTLTKQLRRWQRREFLYRVVWGFARWTALVAVVLALACALDWLIDRSRDTPFFLRVLMAVGQVALYGVAAWYFMGRLNVPGLVRLAGWAEKAIPEFDHRLVTALQLNRPRARTQGMSPALIREVTREAETLSSRHRLTALAETTRLKWAAYVLIPLLLFAGTFTLVRPELTRALLLRQALMDVEIPRSVHITNTTPELWPSGDEVTLSFSVTGPTDENTRGTVTIHPEDQPSETYDVAFAGRNEDGSARFTATLPPATTPFTFRTRIADGRLRQPGAVRFEPRPVVRDLTAWVLLPTYVDPEGKNRYERLQPQAEVVALADWSVRVQVETTKPVASAVLVVYSRNETGIEKESRRVPMQIGPDGQAAGVVFDLPPRPSAYRVEVTDAYGFANSNPPRRGINIAVDEPPQVNLLSEVLKDPHEEGPLDDFDVSGMPLGIGGQVQIGYDARSPLGLSSARVMYRVNDGPWTPLPLKRTEADLTKMGKFLPELGVFQESGPFGQVEFYQIPATNPATEPPGIEGGGRINFQTAALTKTTPNGETAKLEVGDRVELYVEVFDRNPSPGRLPGRSVSRIKTVVSQAQLQAWLDRHDQSRERLKKLEESQRGVFGIGSR